MTFQNLARLHLPLRDRQGDLSLAHGWNDFQHEMDRVFENFDSFFKHTSTALTPLNLDIAETDKAYLITAELPGLDQEDINLTIDDGVLTLKGEKKQQEESGDKTFHRTERSYGSFKRVLQLPSDADEDAVNATMKNGILHIEIGKNENTAPSMRRIEIKTV